MYTYSWTIKGLYTYSWTLKGLYTYSWTLKGLYTYSWTLNGLYTYTWTLKGMHTYSWTLKGMYTYSWALRDHIKFSNIMKYPQYMCFVELSFWIQTEIYHQNINPYSANYFDISRKVQYTLELVYIYKHQLSLHSTNPVNSSQSI